MNQEIKSALIRVLPFIVILFILLIASKNTKITVSELSLNKPYSRISGFFVFVILVEYTLYKF